MANQPTLTDGIVVLDSFTLGDSDAHLAGEDPEHIRRFGLDGPSTEEAVRDAISAWRDSRQTGGPVRAFAVRKAASMVLTGGCELRLRGGGIAEVSYWTFPAFRGLGFASRALRLLCGYAFDGLGVERIELYAEADNPASRGVARKAGFTQEGILRSRALMGGRRRDMVLYSLLVSDPRPV